MANMDNEALNLFEKMPPSHMKDVITWNAMISALWTTWTYK